MLISRTRRLIFSAMGIAGGLAAAGCSDDREPSPRVETASSVPVPTAVADSRIPAADTTTAPSVDSATVSAVPATRARTPQASSAAAPVSTKPGPASPADPVADQRRDTAASPEAVRAPEAASGQDEWLKYDPSTNTVTFELIGGPRGFQFNGYANGEATLTVPSEANIIMNFVNKDGTPHSAEIISGEGPLPNAAVEAAIPRAYTRQLLQGLAQEQSDQMRFAVPQSGTYRIFCGVPGHGLSGMWIWMKVDPAAKVPSFEPTK